MRYCLFPVQTVVSCGARIWEAQPFVSRDTSGKYPRTKIYPPGLLFYDYVLTFGDEVRLVWKPRPNLSAMLYVSIRYSTLLRAMFGLIQSVIVMSGSGRAKTPSGYVFNDSFAN